MKNAHFSLFESFLIFSQSSKNTARTTVGQIESMDSEQ